MLVSVESAVGSGAVIREVRGSWWNISPSRVSSRRARIPKGYNSKDEEVGPLGRVTPRRSEQGIESVRQSSLKLYPLGMTFVKGDGVGSGVEQGRGGEHEGE